VGGRRAGVDGPEPDRRAQREGGDQLVVAREVEEASSAAQARAARERLLGEGEARRRDEATDEEGGAEGHAQIARDLLEAEAEGRGEVEQREADARHGEP